MNVMMFRDCIREECLNDIENAKLMVSSGYESFGKTGNGIQNIQEMIASPLLELWIYRWAILFPKRITIAISIEVYGINKAMLQRP